MHALVCEFMIVDRVPTCMRAGVCNSRQQNRSGRSRRLARQNCQYWGWELRACLRQVDVGLIHILMTAAAPAFRYTRCVYVYVHVHVNVYICEGGREGGRQGRQGWKEGGREKYVRVRG